MNCKKVRKYLFAFADSQLSVQTNCEVLDHLKMCRQCSTIVDDHQALRQALRQAGERIEIPPGLEARVRTAIRRGRPVPHERAWAFSLRTPLLRRLALAAVVVLAATVVWQFGPWSGATRRGSSVAVGSSGHVAKMILQRHNMCVGNCKRGMHQNKLLPRDRTLVAKAISDHFNGRLAAAAPDLSGRGFHFQSANFCCIPQSAGCVSGHIVYVNDHHDTWLSFFSMPHWNQIPANADGDAPDRNHPFTYTLPSGDQTDAVVAWHQGDATYICCGQMDLATMRTTVRDIQLALQDPHRREVLAALFSLK